MKREILFKAALVVAALLFQSAAINTPAAAQSKKSTRRKASRTAGGKTSPEEATPDATAPTPAPAAKANSREASPEASSAPAKKGTTTTSATAAAVAAMPDAPASKMTTGVRYSYEFKQPEFSVSRILIEHDAEGRGQVSFARKESAELFTDPIEISPAALTRIKAAWEALKFLDSDASYQAEKQFPHLGTMTLKMRQGTRERAAEFNWTHDEGITALVKEYRGIGEQQLFIFDVTLARQYQPSDTIKIFKRLESLIKRDELSDTAQLVPLLRDLTTDERIPLMARNHVTRLLKNIEK